METTSTITYNDCEVEPIFSPKTNGSAKMDVPKTRVLIVEDNPDDLELLMCQLRKTQIDEHVKVFTNGRIAVEYLTDSDSQCEKLIAIFLDLNLPSASGLYLLKTIRSHDRIAHLPVIVMTSSNAPRDLEECQKLGVTSYIQKPITFMTFVKAVANSFHVTRTGSLSLRPRLRE